VYATRLFIGVRGMWSFNVSHFLPVLPRFQQGMPILAGLVVTLLSAGDVHASVAGLEADL